MAGAPDPSEPKQPSPVPDPVVAQRALVTGLLVLLVLTGLVLAVAFRDPCARYGGEDLLRMAGQRCQDVVRWTDYIPDGLTFGVLLAIFTLNLLCYELRWVIRAIAPGLLGVVFVGLGVMIHAQGMPVVLGAFYWVFGLALLASAWGIHRGYRAGWSTAAAIIGVTCVAQFFGSSRLADETGWPMSLAILPSLGLLLPIVLALATSPPGGTRYRPFARTPAAA
jgi:hypothetical protein